MKAFCLLLLCVLALAPVVLGFAPRPTRWAGAASLCRMSEESAPSDTDGAPPTSSWASSSSTSSSNSAVKNLLLDTTSSLTRTEINEYVLALEKINPTSDAAYSRLLNGVWEVKSTGFGSPGLVGLQIIKALSSEAVDDITVTISSVAPRVVAATALKLASLRVEVQVTTDLEAVGSTRLKETASAVKLGSFDLPLSSIPGISSLPSLLTSRELFITYLDEDLLIARDALGTPEILMRKAAASFQASTELGVPATDDGSSGAPGV